MNFISVRDLKRKSAKIWKELKKEDEMVITSNGKPIAVMTATSGDTLEESLNAIRIAKAIKAVESIQLESTRKRKDRISLEEINVEIAKTRKARSR